MRERRLVFHLRAADEDRVEGLSMHTICNRYLSWASVTDAWEKGPDYPKAADIPPQYRCRQCESPGKRNPRVPAGIQEE